MRLIFVGPSLRSASFSDDSVQLRPPIQAGDVLDLLDSAPLPSSILLVDGIFGAGQAISVGELREAIGHNIALFGSTSMGALRAAETAPAGMVPLGGIAAEYASGRRINDADVALLHTQDFTPITIPTVNIEYLGRLMQLSGAPWEQVNTFVESCRAIHFTRRTPPAVFEQGARLGLTAGSPWIELWDSPQVWDRKSLDAVESINEFLRLTDDDLLKLASPTTALTDLVPRRAEAERLRV